MMSDERVAVIGLRREIGIARVIEWMTRREVFFDPLQGRCLGRSRSGGGAALATGYYLAGFQPAISRTATGVHECGVAMQEQACLRRNQNRERFEIAATDEKKALGRYAAARPEARAGVWWNRTSRALIGFPETSQGKMDQRTRMATVLVVLAGGMTSTAALLSWMDPGWPGDPENLTPQQLLHFARAVVSDSAVVERQHWEQVEVVARHDPVGRGTLLAATEPADVHFVIDEHGRVAPSAAWSGQVGIDQCPGTIRIEVAIGPAGRGLSAGQWSSLQALTNALGEVTGKPSSLPVYLGAGMADLSPQPTQTGRSDIAIRRAG